MNEERVSYELAQLNKRFLDYYWNYGVYAERKNLKGISHVIKKYLIGRRWKEFGSIILGYVHSKNRQKKEPSNDPLESSEFDPNLRVAVYTCITGGYDDLKEPMYVNEKCCDFYVVTDKDVPPTSCWKKIDINLFKEVQGLENRAKARYVKSHPHIFFKDYDYSIWVDGSVQVIADVMPLVGSMGDAWFGVHNLLNGTDCIYDSLNSLITSKKAPKDDLLRQAKYYKEQGFPRHYGLFDTEILVRRHNDEECIAVMEDWWKQMTEFTLRDQMSINYVMWKNNVEQCMIKILAGRVVTNPRFYWQPHNDFYRRRSKRHH